MAMRLPAHGPFGSCLRFDAAVIVAPDNPPLDSIRLNIPCVSLLLRLPCCCPCFPPPAMPGGTRTGAARKKITLTNPAGEVSDAPVLIRLHTGNFDFLSANENGSDLRVVAGDDATELKFHIEKWDGINQLALVWVKLPKLAASNRSLAVFRQRDGGARVRCQGHLRRRQRGSLLPLCRSGGQSGRQRAERTQRHRVQRRAGGRLVRQRRREIQWHAKPDAAGDQRRPAA